jgi:hypothetical protein
MSAALMWLGASAFILGGLTILFRIEDSFGDQIMLVKVRRAGDRLLGAIRNNIGAHHVKGIDYVRLTWHYVIHIFLRRIIRGIVFLQRRLEETQQRNREAAKVIRADAQSSHLTQIANHKESTALSEEEKKRRKAH